MSLTFEQLLRKGYFPKELPPCFNTEKLADEADGIEALATEWINSNGRTKSSKPCKITYPKLHGFRREICIPNPVNQAKLSLTICENWNAIKAFTDQSKLSVTKLEESEEHGLRAIKLSSSKITHEKIIRSSTFRWGLKLDLSQFYSTIYTHSIPWALHTKEVAKVNRRRIFFGNAIDEDARCCNDVQTMGVLVGPDTSRIISEIIASAIDRAICDKYPNVVGLRHIDDFYFYFDSEGEIEEFYSDVQLIVREYELGINYSKVVKFALPESINNCWRAELRNLAKNNLSTETDFLEFVSRAFELSEKFSDQYVLEYAFSKLCLSEHVYANNDYFEILFSYIFIFIQKDSRLIPMALYLLLKMNDDIDRSLLNRNLDKLLSYHLRREHTFEIIWLLWYYHSFHIKVSGGCCLKLNTLTNPFVVILSLHLEHISLTEQAFEHSAWDSFLTKKHLTSEFWLLAYEGFINHFLTPNEGEERFIDDIPFFEFLSDSDISFFDPNRQVDISQVYIARSSASNDYDQDDEDLDEDDEFSAISTAFAPSEDLSEVDI